jgi:hypothetical protein
MAQASEGSMNISSKESSSYTTTGDDTTESVSGAIGALQERPANPAFRKELGEEGEDPSSELSRRDGTTQIVVRARDK